MEEDLNLKEYVTSFEVSFAREAKFLESVDWSSSEIELQSDRAQAYDYQKKVVEVCLSRASEILSRSKGNPPKFAEKILDRLVELANLMRKRSEKYVNDLSRKDIVDISDLKKFGEENMFLITISTDLERLKKNINKIVKKDQEILFKLKGSESSSLVMQSVIESKSEVVKNYVANKLNTVKVETITPEPVKKTKRAKKK